MASPPPAIRALVDSGSHMCDPYGARALVSASHHTNTERLRTGLLRSYQKSILRLIFASNPAAFDNGESKRCLTVAIMRIAGTRRKPLLKRKRDFLLYLYSVGRIPL